MKKGSQRVLLKSGIIPFKDATLCPGILRTAKHNSGKSKGEIFKNGFYSLL